jgi:hypothetical protein
MSGRKNTILQFHNIVNGDMSTPTITSAVTNIQFLDNIGIQLNFTGTPVGTFQVQVSADYAQDNLGNVQNPGNWIPITLPITPDAGGVAGQIYIDLNQLSAPWLRVVYGSSSGTGVLNGYLTAKEL